MFAISNRALATSWSFDPAAFFGLLLLAGSQLSPQVLGFWGVVGVPFSPQDKSFSRGSA